MDWGERDKRKLNRISDLRFAAWPRSDIFIRRFSISLWERNRGGRIQQARPWPL